MNTSTSILLLTTTALLSCGQVARAHDQIEIYGFGLQFGGGHSSHYEHSHGSLQVASRNQALQGLLNSRSGQLDSRLIDPRFDNRFDNRPVPQFDQRPVIQPVQNSRFLLNDFDPRFSGSYFMQNGGCFYQGSGHRLVQLRYGGCTHLADLAARFEFLAHELVLDLQFNYSHNRGFRATYAEALQLLDGAQLVRSLAHDPRSRHILRAQLIQLDGLFHHIEDDVCHWTRIPRRPVGNMGLQTRLNLMEATLHHLMFDAGIRR
jgi:hypothetical protein